MASENWEEAKRVFGDAIKFAPEQRTLFLDEACNGDADMRREVESLLASFDDAASFMEVPAVGKIKGNKEGNDKNLKKGVCFGHYEIIELIGAGGMGEVYLAKDKKLGRRVAVKILNEKFAKNESNLKRFTQEAKAASGLNHPNILVIHEISEADSANFIVSEFIEGKTLREIFEGPSLKLSEGLDIAIQIAGALTAAHAANIVHRDIKPENIMVRPDGYVKVLDFGLAKLIEQKAVGFEDETAQQNQTAKGLILGTVSYMSPEQARGEQIDGRTDIFSYGILLYEMIAGRTPFAGNSMSETFANLINSDPQPLSRFAANVPDELARMVSKALRKDRDERYQTMKDLLADLKSLRENLAFDERLERSQPQEGKRITVDLLMATGDANKQTGETKYSFAGQVKRSKLIAPIAVAVLLVAVVTFGYYFWFQRNAAQSFSGKKSLAVLPFVNASQDPNAEYLSDGITESIINNLSQLAGLKVMSRNSAFRFKTDQIDTRSIAVQLGVETLVTGDIRQLGDRLVINVRLIDGKDDSQIWGHQYVKTSADIIGAQNEIAQAVANNLRLKLTDSEQKMLAKNYTENVEAYQLYLRGRFHVFKLTPPDVYKGIAAFEKAIEIDPNYALAHVGISEAYRSLTLSGEMLPTEFLPKSKAAAQKALDIDDRLPEAHTALGACLFWYDWNWSESEAQYQKALELSPNDSNTHLFYAHLLSNTGRHPEGLAQVKRARELDPLFPFVNTLEGQFLLNAGRSDEAFARLQKTIELAPNFWFPHIFISAIYTEKGMYAEAVNAANRARELSPTQTNSHSLGGFALAKSGKTDEARATLEDLLQMSSKRFVPPYHLATIYNGLGETDNTFIWLEKSFEQRDPKLTFLKVDQKWNNLRSDPRFIDLMRRMNFE